MATRSTSTRFRARIVAMVSVRGARQPSIALQPVASLRGPFVRASSVLAARSRWRGTARRAPRRARRGAVIAVRAAGVVTSTAMAAGQHMARRRMRVGAGATCAAKGSPRSLRSGPRSMPQSVGRVTRLRGGGSLRTSMVSGRRVVARSLWTRRRGGLFMSVMDGCASSARLRSILAQRLMLSGRLLIILFRSLVAGRMIRRIFVWRMWAVMLVAGIVSMTLRGCCDGWEEATSSGADRFAWR